jgi:hypothetical protein
MQFAKRLKQLFITDMCVRIDVGRKLNANKLTNATQVCVSFNLTLPH